MKFFGSVAAVVDAVLLTGAQVIAGVKTFTSAIVAAAGIQLASLWNTNGTGASDVCLKVGTSTADGSVDASAALVAVMTGIGGTEVTQAVVGKGRVAFGQGTLDAASHFASPNDADPTFITAWDSRHAVFGESGSAGRAFGVSWSGAGSTINQLYIQPNVAWQTAQSFAKDFKFYSPGPLLGLQQDTTGLVTCNLGANVKGALQVNGASTNSGKNVLAATDGGSAQFEFSRGAGNVTPGMLVKCVAGQAAALLAGSSGCAFAISNGGSFAITAEARATFDSGLLGTGPVLMSVSAGGNVGVTGALAVNGGSVASTAGFEATDAGGGVVLKSPNGTRYKLTVTNGGALSVAAV